MEPVRSWLNRQYWYCYTNHFVDALKEVERLAAAAGLRWSPDL
jgi:hypothetical protein